MKKFRSMLSILCACALLMVCLPVMTFSASASAASSNTQYHYFTTDDLTYNAAEMTVTPIGKNNFLMSIPSGGTVGSTYAMASVTLPYETWSQMPYLHVDLNDASTANLNIWVYAGNNSGNNSLMAPFNNAAPATYAGVSTLDFSPYVASLSGQSIRVQFYVITGANGQTLNVNGIYASSSAAPFASQVNDHYYLDASAITTAYTGVTAVNHATGHGFDIILSADDNGGACGNVNIPTAMLSSYRYAVLEVSASTMTNWAILNGDGSCAWANSGFAVANPLGTFVLDMTGYAAVGPYFWSIGTAGQKLTVDALYLTNEKPATFKPITQLGGPYASDSSYAQSGKYGFSFVPGGTDHYAYFAADKAVVDAYPYLYYKFKTVPATAPSFYVGNVWHGDYLTILDVDDTDLHCIDLRTLPSYGQYNGQQGFHLLCSSNVEFDVYILSDQDNFVYGEAAGTTHEVTFNANGGTYVGTQKVPNGGTVDAVTAPTRANHTFRGWFTDIACTQPYNFSNAVSSDMTLYAGWSIQSGISSAFAQVLKNTNLSSTSSDIRFVATIPTRSYLSEVGFVFSLSNTNPTVGGTNCKAVGTDTVYSSILADGTTVTSTQLGGVYVVACSVTNIPNANFNTPIYVTAYAKNDNGEYTYGATRVHCVSNWLSANVKDNGAAGDGETDDAQAFLNTFAMVGNNGTVIVPAGTYAISTNITVPAGVTLVVDRGAKFTVANGITLTINGKVDAGMYQIFEGAGTVGGNIQGEGYAQWFGATMSASMECTAALQKAVNVLSHVILPYGTGTALTDAGSSYYRFSTIYINKPVIIEGRGGVRTNIAPVGAGHTFVINSSDVTFKNFYAWGNGDSNTQAAIFYFNTASYNLNNIRIENCYVDFAGHMIADAQGAYSVTNATVKKSFCRSSRNIGVYMTDFSTGIVLDEIVADYTYNNSTGIHVENCTGMYAYDLDSAMGHNTAQNAGQVNDGIVFKNCSNITLNRAMVDAVGGTPFKFINCTNMDVKNLVASIFSGWGIMLQDVTSSTFSIIKVNGTISDSAGMQMASCSNVRLNNLTVQQCPTGGFALVSCTNNIISNLYTTGNSYGAQETNGLSYGNIFLGVSGQSVTTRGMGSTVQGQA